MYITIVGINRYLGIDSLKIGDVFNLEKDFDNKYDDEAISIKNDNNLLIGYVANSVRMVARGTHSAGYVYQSVKENTKCKIEFIIGGVAIAKII